MGAVVAAVIHLPAPDDDEDLTDEQWWAQRHIQFMDSWTPNIYWWRAMWWKGRGWRVETVRLPREDSLL